MKKLTVVLSLASDAVRGGAPEAHAEAGVLTHALHRSGGEHLILYDGACGLCNRLNTFVLRRDLRGLFDFAPLQSATGRSLLRQFGRDAQDLDTFYVVTNYRSELPTLLSKSQAALFVAKTLGPPWRWIEAFRVFPRTLLNGGYDLVARHRYRLFGRSETCLMPSAEYARRFIDP